MQNVKIDKDLLSIQQARTLSRSARLAYEKYSKFSQDEVDKIVDATTKAALENAKRLAMIATEETGYGNVEDKTTKNIFAAKNVYDSIKDLKTVGVIQRDEKNKIIEIAHPMGVVCAITPTTNPTSTIIFKSLISLKTRNAVVFAPHPRALECSKEAVLLMREAAETAGAPLNILSCLDPITIEGTNTLMSSPDIAIILATGGTAMVKAAHSYGKPAIGVGPGNTPAYVDKSADLKKAALDILSSKTFDNGVICASEQAIIVHKDIHTAFRKIIESLGGYFLSESEKKKIESLLIKKDAMNAEMVGKSAKILADASSFAIPPNTRLLIAPLKEVGPSEPLSREILAPIIAYYVEDNWEHACKRCMQILHFGGLGHTLAVHAHDQDVIHAFSHEKPVFRILINTPTSQGAIGASTSLSPSMTLSTGTWGGGISSDNISARHLMNIKRVAYETNPINIGKNDFLDIGMQREDIESIVRKVIKEINI